MSHTTLSCPGSPPLLRPPLSLSLSPSLTLSRRRNRETQIEPMEQGRALKQFPATHYFWAPKHQRQAHGLRNPLPSSRTHCAIVKACRLKPLLTDQLQVVPGKQSTAIAYSRSARTHKIPSQVPNYFSVWPGESVDDFACELKLALGPARKQRQKARRD